MANNKDYNKKGDPAIKLKGQPNNEQLEKDILSIIMNDPSVADDAFNISIDDFYIERHRIIYKKMYEQHQQGLPFDLVAIISLFTEEEKDKVGGIAYLSDISNTYMSSVNLSYEIDLLKNLSRARELISVSTKMSSMAYDNSEPLDIMTFAMNEINRISLDLDKKDLKQVAETANNVIDEIINIYNTGERPKALSTGYSNLDSIANGGFLPGQMIVLAARPGCGKTSFAMSIVANIAQTNPEKVIAVFNLEMSQEELIKRLIASLAQIDSKSVIRNELTSDQISRILETKKDFSKCHIYIDDSSNITADQIKAKVNKLKNKEGRIDLIVIDHMQLIADNKVRSRYESMTEISRMMKIIAKELEVPVLVLSQMSRNVEKTDEKNNSGEVIKQKKPKMSDLRESGAIEQDADMIIFLTPGDESEEVAETENTALLDAVVAKNRSGEADVDLFYVWHKDTMTFVPKKKITFINKPKKQEAKTENSGSEQIANNDYYIDDSVLTDAEAPEEYSVDSDYLDGVNNFEI